MKHRAGNVGGDEGLMRGREDRAGELGSAGRGLRNNLSGTGQTDVSLGRHRIDRHLRDGLLSRFGTGRILRVLGEKHA